MFIVAMAMQIHICAVGNHACRYNLIFLGDIILTYLAEWTEAPTVKCTFIIIIIMAGARAGARDDSMGTVRGEKT